jgi:hypothetical protein
MADEKERPRGPSEYAQKEAAAGQAKPRPRTGCFYKLLGLLLVALAAWLVWYNCRTGWRANLLDEKEQERAFREMTSDYHKALEVGGDFAKWTERELTNLEKRLKGAPPKTKEESAALVKESKQAVEKADAQPGASVEGTKAAGAKPGVGTKAPIEAKSPVPPPPVGPLAKARAEYEEASRDYMRTDPDAPQAQVQQYLRAAAGHFEKCLYWLDQARAARAPEAEVGSLEQQAAKRLYDCRKRMELTR